MQLPQANAVLLAVRRRIASENYTSPAKDSAVWGGQIDAYVERKIVSGFNAAGELNRAEQVTLIIPSDTQAPVNIEAGDELEFEQQTPTGSRRHTARVATFSTPANLPNLPQYIKIAVEKVSAQP
jgi:hypothetical protein